MRRSKGQNSADKGEAGMNILSKRTGRAPVRVQLSDPAPATNWRQRAAAKEAAAQQAAQQAAPSGGRTGGGGGGSRGGATLESYVKTLYDAYRPPRADYEAMDAAQLSAQIASWLRPVYERAMQARREQTAAYRAELDADAIARGMGSSTYVTDVKSRQLADEAEDVAALEGEYGAELGRLTMEAAEAEREREMEVALFNRQQDEAAYMKAYEAALALYETAARRSGGGSRGGSGGGGAQPAVPATTAENCERFLAGLTGQERYAVYTGTDAENARYRSEIIASVGSDGLLELMRRYPF